MTTLMECITQGICYTKECNNPAKPPKVDIEGGETAVPYCDECLERWDKKWELLAKS